MKDKEKQIEEIYNIIDERCINGKDNNGMPTIACVNQMAENIYNAGYRKIPKDSVVLSREQYSNYLITQTNNEWLKEQAEKLQADNERLYKNLGKFKQSVSKETSEKFLQLAYDRCLEKSFIKKVEELAKQFGVEIKE